MTVSDFANSSFYKSVVRNEDGIPSWNINQTTAFPIEINLGKARPKVYIYLSPYTADELKSILKKATAGYKRDRQDVEIVREDMSIYTPLFDNHFVKMAPTTSDDPAKQKAFFDKRPEIKPSIVENTFGALLPTNPAMEGDDILDLDIDLGLEVAVHQSIYDETIDAVVRIDMVHHYSRPTEGQYREYRSARRNKFMRRSELWTMAENHGTMEHLYDSIIDSVDGVLVDGMKCTKGTKDSWIKKIPLWHKLAVVDQIFGDVIEKNG